MNWQIFLSKNIVTNKNFNTGFGLVVVLFFTYQYFLFCVQPGYIDADGGIFSAIAQKMIDGAILYEDAWENKPPGIFYLIIVFMKLTPNAVNAVFFLGFSSILLSAFAFYFIALKCTKSILFSIAFVISILPVVFDKGMHHDFLYTEFYGILMILLSVLFWLIFIDKKKTYFFNLSLIFLGFSFWFKEPFFIVVVALYLYYFKSLDNKKLAWKGLFFLSIPSFVFVIVLLFSDSFWPFVDILKYNFLYAKSDVVLPAVNKVDYILKPLITFNFPLFLLFFVSFIHLIFSRNRAQLLFLLLVLLSSLVFVFLTPYNFQHYYFPFFALFFVVTLLLLRMKLEIDKKLSFVFYFLMFYQLYGLNKNDDIKWNVKFETYNEDKFTKTIKQNKGTSLYIDIAEGASYYAKTGLNSPTFLPVPLPVHFAENKIGIENRTIVWNELTQTPPDFIIRGNELSYYNWFFESGSFYDKKYVLIDSISGVNNKKLFLLKLK